MNRIKSELDKVYMSIQGDGLTVDSEGVVRGKSYAQPISHYYTTQMKCRTCESKEIQEASKTMLTFQAWLAVNDLETLAYERIEAANKASKAANDDECEENEKGYEPISENDLDGFWHD